MILQVHDELVFEVRLPLQFCGRTFHRCRGGGERRRSILALG
jgi:hypothetical protein